MNEPYNAADPKQVKQRIAKVKRQQDAKADDLKALMLLPQFRAFMWDLINNRCGLMRSPYSPNGSTQTWMIGRQDVGRELYADIEQIDPNLITQMMGEYAETQK